MLHCSLFGPQKCDDIVRLHHAHEPVCAVHNREGMQVVFVEQFRDFILVGFRMTGDNARFGQNGDARLAQCQDQARERNDSFQYVVVSGEINLGYALRVPIKLP